MVVHKTSRHDKTLGFTLMELLLVIGIIGILIAVSTSSYTTAQKKARDARKMEDFKSIQQAFEQYYVDHNGVYPTSPDELVTPTPRYLPGGFPTDPKGTPYPTPETSATSYCMCTLLDSGRGNASDDACTFVANGSYYCIKNAQ